MDRILLFTLLFGWIFVVESSGVSADSAEEKILRDLDMMRYETGLAARDAKELCNKTKDLFLISIGYDTGIIDGCTEKIETLISTYKKYVEDNKTLYSDDIDILEKLEQKIDIEIRIILEQISDTSDLLGIIAKHKEDYFRTKKERLEKVLKENLSSE